MADITKLQIGNDELDITKKQDKMAILSYGHSTWSDFIDVYQKNAVVYCRASSNSNPATGSQTRMAFMAYVNNAENPTNVEFQYVRSVSTKTASQPVDQVYVYTLANTNGGTWTVQTRNMASKLAAGTGASVTYSNGTYTIGATEVPIPTKTSDLTNDGSDGTSTYVESDELATVATTGSYEDLSDKPTIPAAQVNSDWNSSSGVSQILNKPTLSTVATSGSYDDLTDKPTIPTVNNATLTIQKNGTTVKTFTANASSNVTANITVPTKTSDITNDSNFVASGDLATVATSGSYNDLSNKPTIPAKQVFYGTSDSSGGSSSKAVACSGFTYAEGNMIYVTFSDADTYSGDSGMTMNVNSTGAKVIFTQTTSGGGVQNDHKWAAGETVCFVCHNDRYLMVEAAMATTTTSGLMSVSDKNKLDGIASGAEANVQANWAESNSSSDAYIQNKPSLATVATSGSYNDLTNKPTVPEIKKRTGASTTTNITPLYVAGDGTTTTPMALKTHGDTRNGSFAYININEPTDAITEAYAGGYVWDEDEDWWRKMSEVRLALYSDIPTAGTITSGSTGYATGGDVYTAIGNVETILQTLNNGGGAQ